MRNTATEEDVSVVRIELDGLIVVLDGALRLATRAIGRAADRKCNGQILSAKLPRLDGVGTSGDLLVPGDIRPARALHCLSVCVQAGSVVTAIDDTIAERRTIIADAAAQGAAGLVDGPKVV